MIKLDKNYFYCTRCEVNTHHMDLPEARSRLCKRCGFPVKYRSWEKYPKIKREVCVRSVRVCVSPAGIKQMRALRKAGKLQGYLAKRFGVAQSTVSYLTRGCL